MNSNIKTILRKLEQTREKYWNIPPETGQFLNILIKTRGFKKVLEIGTSNGYSAIWLGEALNNTGGHLWTIESNKKNRFPLATQNISKSGLKNITQILGHAPEAIPKTPRFFDLAFFDATKCEHQDYFNALKTRIKKGGTIITDNAISHADELEGYLKLVQKDKNWHTELLSIGTGLMLSLKK